LQLLAMPLTRALTRTRPLTRQQKGCLLAALIGAAAHHSGIVKPQRKVLHSYIVLL
jgi:hypothetical protein